MSENTLKFNNIKLNNKKNHRSKEPIDLLLADFDQMFYLINLNTMTKASSALKTKLLNHDALFCLK